MIVVCGGCVEVRMLMDWFGVWVWVWVFVEWMDVLVYLECGVGLVFEW